MCIIDEAMITMIVGCGCFCLWFLDLDGEDASTTGDPTAGVESRTQVHLIGKDLLCDGAGSTTLLVTAHPDDESMFFTPIILYLASAEACVHVLCLSTGAHGTLRYVRAIVTSVRLKRNILHCGRRHGWSWQCSRSRTRAELPAVGGRLVFI